VLWGNSNADGDAEAAQIYAGGSSALVVRNSIVQNLDVLVGNHNIDIDPEFIDDSTGDFRIAYTSHALNHGDADDMPADTYDIDDDSNTNEKLPGRDMDARQVNPDDDCIDLGAFENQVAGTCAGDITGAGSVPDGTVNSSDLLLVMTRWGEPGGVADLDPQPCGDGTVDIDDYLVVNNNWGDCEGEGFGGGGDDPIEILLAILDEHPELASVIEEIIEYLN
jgi:hypothetical protein